MRDWKGIAQASGIEIPAASVEKAAASLQALEKVTAPLFQKLVPEQESACVFDFHEEAGQ